MSTLMVSNIPQPIVSPGLAPATNRAGESQPANSAQASENDRSKRDSSAPGIQGAESGTATEKSLSPEELRVIEKLEQRDREVRQHEKAHEVMGGPYTGSATYDYQRGPDGKRYAIGGQVTIDYGPIKGDPEATIDKMKTVIAAALAPAEPSPQDMSIAARARQNLLEARLEANRLQGEMDNARDSARPSPDSVRAAVKGDV